MADPECEQLFETLDVAPRKARSAMGTHKCDEEENDVHDGEGKAGLEHSASLVDMQR